VQEKFLASVGRTGKPPGPLTFTDRWSLHSEWRLQTIADGTACKGEYRAT